MLVHTLCPTNNPQRGNLGGLYSPQTPKPNIAVPFRGRKRKDNGHAYKTASYAPYLLYGTQFRPDSGYNFILSSKFPGRGAFPGYCGRRTRNPLKRIAGVKPRSPTGHAFASSTCFVALIESGLRGRRDADKNWETKYDCQDAIRFNPSGSRRLGEVSRCRTI